MANILNDHCSKRLHGAAFTHPEHVYIQLTSGVSRSDVNIVSQD